MVDFSIDEIQRNMALRLARESKMDRTIDVMTIIQSLRPDAQGRIATEAILIEGQHSGMSEKEVLATLEELVRNRTVTMADGFVVF